MNTVVKSNSNTGTALAAIALAVFSLIGFAFYYVNSGKIQAPAVTQEVNGSYNRQLDQQKVQPQPLQDH